MLETIAKGRLGTGRPAGIPQTESHAKAAPNPGFKLQDILDKQREEEIRNELIVQQQRDQYDFQTSERAELDREYNSARDLVVEQMKRDDETLKKYISMI